MEVTVVMIFSQFLLIFTLTYEQTFRYIFYLILTSWRAIPRFPCPQRVLGEIKNILEIIAIGTCQNPLKFVKLLKR